MIQYKSENGQDYRDRLEFQFSHQIDPRLRGVLWELDDWSVRTTGKNITITCLNRTVEQNKKDGGKERSAHLYSRAADIRSYLLSALEIEKVVAHLNEVWGTEYLHVVYHDSGRGDHIHININRPFHRKNYAGAA